MPVNKITSSKRGIAAVAAAALFALTSGWATLMHDHPTPAKVHELVAKGYIPPAVRLAVDKLIKPWEGFSNKAYLDIVKVPTICYGATSGVKMGDYATDKECEDRLINEVIHDYYLPLVDGVADFVLAPDSVQAAATSGAYNFGLFAMKKSTAARWIVTHNYRQACEAQTAFNKAGKKIVRGLVVRREMGDAQRMGEAELCVSGL
jgi:GH24 family phage-related lysozyme (muramidase)